MERSNVHEPKIYKHRHHSECVNVGEGEFLGSSVNWDLCAVPEALERDCAACGQRY